MTQTTVNEMGTLTFGSLFAGIGGLDLGLERAGMECRWQVEIDDYAQRVLAKHWPDVRRHDDVRTWPDGDVEPVDLICGGFPCQDISYAGAGAGLSGERSGLFFETVRVVRLLRPRFVLLENVAALLTRGLDRVHGELAALGYCTESHCVPASYVGARQLRDRVWIVAHAECDSIQGGAIVSTAWRGESREEQLAGLVQPCAWPTLSESRDRGAGNGVPSRVHRNRGLGNAVVPQVAEWIGRQIVGSLDRDDGE